MKKSEVVYDLSLINERLDQIMDSKCINGARDELMEIASKIKNISSELNKTNVTFSITGRAKPLVNKCRFCGK
ncbi:conserved hypothetical protein [Vibrio crassostreae]|uniref:hypothetical protein n=1 Tax=Vibrio crassostreae TaxID=246167 RepID=UPI000F494006|nr:hypothetical protein [Vibrio crassostreae]ROR14126.1 hypothetical protein EDB36_107124 [Vibrio crassostreae]CAK2136747.1 conserved hypothetical protein [Vibrio crassostreae]CAK2356333.1 conserved hypothetical protein [Vibrio crassostreae]CAK2371110.1 conserved hypothetical protein [Vibrio crassostreae]CAK3507519.1 conserved hypothetical protein [Vibrio crassostreae]